MTEADLAEEFDHWERKENTLYLVLPYFLLSVGTLITLLQPLWDVYVNVPAVLFLAGFALSWILWLYTLHPEWRERTKLMAVYYSGLWALAAGLVVLSPWYGIFAFLGYIHAFECLRGRWRFLGTAGTATTLSTTYIGGVKNLTEETWWAFLILVAFSIVVASAFSHFADMADVRNRRQK